MTPFRNDGADVDEDVLAEIAGKCDRVGIHVVVALGNTAELYQLTGRRAAARPAGRRGRALRRRAARRTVGAARAQPELAELLEEMTIVRRSAPGATW